MKVLLISSAFYGYHCVIRKGIEKLGFECDEYIFAHGFLYNILSILPISGKISDKLRDNHFKRHISRYAHPYDKIVVIKGSCISNENHRLLRELNPAAKFSLYIWDDIALDMGELDIMQYYDKVFSYNPQDCLKYNMIFRPMFFDNTIDKPAMKKDIDLFYIASYRKNRIKFIEKVLENTKAYRIRYKVILKSSLPFFFSRCDNIKHWRFFRFHALPYQEMYSFLNRSRCSIELCRPGQEALSTRAFESLYTQTKIITTNESIKDYDFYCADNVLVVDENNPSIPEWWIKTPFYHIDKCILEKYSLDSFCSELLTDN